MTKFRIVCDRIDSFTPDKCKADVGVYTDFPEKVLELHPEGCRCYARPAPREREGAKAHEKDDARP